MSWLWLVPTLPLAGALLLALLGGLMPRRAAGALGCLSVGLSWIVSLKVAAGYLAATPATGAYGQTLFRWMDVGTFRIPMGLYLDQLSLIMMLVVAFVGFVIHLYSAEYMIRGEGYSRFFCYMNLFVGSMLILVLADNLLSLYLGWEGVGLCSYLLIGFWYQERANGFAAQKAFVDEFVQLLPEKYDTMVGEHGATLSGGQRQRIAIARAMLRDPAILIFDEAMSQVDSDSERRIHQVMEEFVKGRTTVMIAHRFATVLAADRIAVLDRGQILDVGTHADLLARCQLYEHLYRTQFVDSGG